MNSFNYYIFLNLISFFTMILMILFGVAFLTLFERKILGYIQIRKGPNKNFMIGIFQPFSDAMKLLTKEIIIMKFTNYLYFFMSPILSFFISLIIWLIYPFYLNLFYFKYSLLFIFCCLGLGVYSSMIGGWSSNSNYSMLGSIRAVAQSISYEVSMILMIFCLMIMTEEYNLLMFNNYQYYLSYFWLMIPLYLMFYISLLAELNRTPFDLIEGESELVSGFNTEYFSAFFTLFFMAEYSMIMFMSMMITLLFFKFNNYFIFIYLIHLISILWIRGVLPRIRYDQLMMMCWKMILPLTLIFLFFVFSMKLMIIMKLM
nr:NADH dehydrogenase subunit 1 [Cerceris albofasciata]